MNHWKTKLARLRANALQRRFRKTVFPNGLSYQRTSSGSHHALHDATREMGEPVKRTDCARAYAIVSFKRTYRPRERRAGKESVHFLTRVNNVACWILAGVTLVFQEHQDLSLLGLGNDRKQQMVRTRDGHSKQGPKQARSRFTELRNTRPGQSPYSVGPHPPVGIAAGIVRALSVGVHRGFQEPTLTNECMVKVALSCGSLDSISCTTPGCMGRVQSKSQHDASHAFLNPRLLSITDDHRTTCLRV